MVEVRTGSSQKEKGFEAGKSAADKAFEGDEKLVYLFASTEFDLEEVLKGVSEVFSSTEIIGCSSTAEIVGDDIFEGSVVVGTLSGDIVIGTGIGEGLEEDSEGSGHSAIQEAFKDLDCDEVTPFSKGRLSEWAEHREVFVNTFADPKHGNAEKVLEGVNSFLGPGFSSTGEFASDQYEFENTAVFYEGEVKEDAVVTAVVDTGKSVGSARAHGFRPTPNDFDVTDVEGDVVHELSGKKPEEVYAEVFGTEKAEDPEFLLMAPFGMKSSREDIHRLRVAIDVEENGCYRCLPPPSLNEDVQLMMGEKNSMLNAARKAARKARENTGLEKSEIEAGIIFSCAARYAIYEEADTAEKEIHNIRKGLGENAEIFGLFGYGQIATSEGWTSLNNDTVVVQALGSK
ncbi:MAG: FIST signal transduction protein [Candidatus Nanohalobium sp.]